MNFCIEELSIYNHLVHFHGFVSSICENNKFYFKKFMCHDVRLLKETNKIVYITKKFQKSSNFVSILSDSFWYCTLISVELKHGFFRSAFISLSTFSKIFLSMSTKKLLRMPYINGTKNNFFFILINSTLAMKINAKVCNCSVVKTNTKPRMYSNRNQINFQG